MIGQAEPQWLDAAAAELMEADPRCPSSWEYALEPRRNEYRALVRAALPAIREGLADEIETRDLVGGQLAAAIVRGQS